MDRFTRICAAAVLLLAPPLGAQCVYDISTRFDNASGKPADPLGAADDQYTVDDGLGGGPQPALTFPGNAFPVPPWLGNTTRSVWISPTGDTNAAPGLYTYEIKFTMPDGVDL